MSHPVIAIALSTLAIAVLAWRFLRGPTAEGPGEGRLGLRSRRLVSAEQICRQAATRLKLDVVYVERTEGTIRPFAGVPWPVHFEFLDTMAVEACLDSGEPAGIGSGQHGASDWLFIPLRKNSRTVAAVGVAGPHCRRRFETEDPGIVSLRQNFERYLVEKEAMPKAMPPHAVASGHADAA
nr:hypothetical protein [uncultured Sphingomonas sp.]